MKAAFASWLSNTRLAAFIGRKHAEYLRDLFELLAQHDDEQVLRRAIPLGKGGGEAGPPALLPPSPRTSLAISLGPKTVSSSVGLVAELFQRLRDSYEAVFARLDAAGKHECAIELPSDDLDGNVSLTLHGGSYAMSVANDLRTRILVGASAAPKPHVDLLLHGAKHSALRCYDDLLLIGDEAGRLIGIEPATGSPVYDLRT